MFDGINIVISGMGLVIKDFVKFTFEGYIVFCNWGSLGANVVFCFSVEI